MTVQQVIQSSIGIHQSVSLKEPVVTARSILGSQSTKMPSVAISAAWPNDSSVYVAGESFKVTIQFECQSGDTTIHGKGLVHGDSQQETANVEKTSPIWAKLSGMDRLDYVHAAHHANLSAQNTAQNDMSLDTPEIKVDKTGTSPSIITLKPSHGATAPPGRSVNSFPRLEFSELGQSTATTTAVSPILPRATPVHVSRKLNSPLSKPGRGGNGTAYRQAVGALGISMDSSIKSTPPASPFPNRSKGEGSRTSSLKPKSSLNPFEIRFAQSTSLRDVSSNDGSYVRRHRSHASSTSLQHSTSYSSHDSRCSTMASGTSLSMTSSRHESRSGIMPGVVNYTCAFVQLRGDMQVDPNSIDTTLLVPLLQRPMYGVPGSGGGMNGHDQTSEKSAISYPVLSMPPAVLFYSLEMHPGERKAYSYEITLPKCLPPTHRGRVLKISYKLELLLQMPDLSMRKFTFPVRIFNHFNREGSSILYDVERPVILFQDRSVVQEESQALFRAHSSTLAPSTTDYDATGKPTRKHSTLASVTSEKGSPIQESSMRTILHMCRTSRNATFDICKNKVMVAQLCLYRTLYQLGDDVVGCITFPQGQISSYQISCMLETQEMLQGDFSLKDPNLLAKFTRRIHAEQHDAVSCTNKLFLRLPIPVHGPVEFSTTLASLRWQLRLEFITSPANRLNEPMYTPGTVVTDKPKCAPFTPYIPSQTLPANTFSCIIPLRVLPTDYDSLSLYQQEKTYMIDTDIE